MATDWAASALKWWQDAGVDTIVGETPRDWLAGEKKPTAAAVREAVAESGYSHPPTGFAGGSLHAQVSRAPRGSALSGGQGDLGIPERERGVELPDTLEAFQAWLVSGEVEVKWASAARVGPAGDPGAGLMVLVDMPSDEDVSSGVLLSGEPGATFDRMMTAIGRSRASLYLASLSPARTPTGKLDPTSARRLAEVARHHIGLVRPKALLLFGDACARALLGAPVTQSRGKWHELATPAGNISTLVTIRPENLLPGQTAMRKMAWEDLQLLREGLNP